MRTAGLWPGKREGARPTRLDGFLGITRVARITGLDRLGVEVACAVRPGGHVLQVSNGKGETWADAAQSARMEAAELWAAERLPKDGLHWGTAEEVRQAFPEAEVLPLDEVERPEPPEPKAHEDAHDELAFGAPSYLRSGWVPAEELLSGRPAWVPAWAVHCPAAGAPLLGPALASWTSNGMGAHTTKERALEHALYEAVERDQLARALPQGWTPGAIRRTQLAPPCVERVAPKVAEWAARAAHADFELYVFDLTVRKGPGALDVPLAAALLFDKDEGPVPWAAGYAAAPTLEVALLKAFLEAAQSRLTDIHGAREDIAPADVGVVRAFRVECTRAAGRRAPTTGRVERRPLRALLSRLRRRGYGRVFRANLCPFVEGLSVVKVITPGFVRSRLL